jgi:hypothetical protein
LQPFFNERSVEERYLAQIASQFLEAKLSKLPAAYHPGFVR